jgi:hypothetical protein
MPYKDLKKRGEIQKRWRKKNPLKVKEYQRRAYFKRNGYFSEDKPLNKRVGRHNSFKRWIYLANLKATTPCADCHKLFPPFVMDCDHVRGEKVAPVSSLAAKGSIKVFLDEIAKCDIVCSNCHRIRTFTRRPPKQFENAGLP